MECLSGAGVSVAHPYGYRRLAQGRELLGDGTAMGDQREGLGGVVPDGAVVGCGLRGTAGYDDAVHQEVTHGIAQPDDPAVHQEGEQVVAYVSYVRGVGRA